MPTEVKALQAALAGVHAALWGYGVAGALLTGSDRDEADRAYLEYRTLRAELDRFVRDRGTTPVAAEPGYELPFPVRDAGTARRLAIHLEDGCLPLFGDLIAAARDPELRTLAARTLSDCASRRVRFEAQPLAFPGLPT